MVNNANKKLAVDLKFHKNWISKRYKWLFKRVATYSECPSYVCILFWYLQIEELTFAYLIDASRMQLKI